MPTYSLAQINQMDRAEFTQALGDLFEHTPMLASRTWSQQPFADLDSLYQALVQTLGSLSLEEQRALICAHPDLATRTKMAAASVREQTSVGLNALSPENYHQFASLNRAYRQKFGFPFIIAVRHHTPASILAAFQQRLQHPPEIEQRTALDQIAEIVRLRLLDRVQP